MWTQMRQRALAAPLGGDRVVEVLRARRVDRERGEVAQVAARDVRRRRSPSAAVRAARSTAGSKRRRRPRSSISASSTSRATSGRPMRRSTFACPRPPWPPRPPTRSSTRSPRPRAAVAVDDQLRPAAEERLADQEAPALVEHRDDAPSAARPARARAARSASPRLGRQLGERGVERLVAPRRVAVVARRARPARSRCPPRRPLPPRLRPLGRKYWPTVRSSAPPFGSSRISWKTPLPYVFVPTTSARLRSCSAPVTISAEEAVPRSTSTTTGTERLIAPPVAV